MLHWSHVNIRYIRDIIPRNAIGTCRFIFKLKLSSSRNSKQINISVMKIRHKENIAVSVILFLENKLANRITDISVTNIKEFLGELRKFKEWKQTNSGPLFLGHMKSKNANNKIQAENPILAQVSIFYNNKTEK